MTEFISADDRKLLLLVAKRLFQISEQAQQADFVDIGDDADEARTIILRLLEY